MVYQMLVITLHLGITEAGGLMPETIKSSIGMGSLWAGLGDTIRVSLSEIQSKK